MQHKLYSLEILQGPYIALRFPLLHNMKKYDLQQKVKV